ICNPEPYDPDEHGFFILVEPGDTSEQIEMATGYSLLKSLFSDTEYGDPDFSPDFEYLEDQGGFYEAVFIFTDSGFGVVIIIPKEEGIDGRILELCSEYAISTSPESGTQIMTSNPNPHPEPISPEVAAFVKSLDENMLEYFLERAAIGHYEAGMSMDDAEHFARELTRSRFNIQK
ncbi:MAG: hypothetical protein WAW61_17605, partial [Methylococcaceae bacterium]